MPIAGIDVIDSVFAEKCISPGLMKDFILYTLPKAFGFNCPVIGLYRINGNRYDCTRSTACIPELLRHAHDKQSVGKQLDLGGRKIMARQLYCPVYTVM